MPPLRSRKDIEKAAKGTTTKRAVESFENYFSKQYGPRWPALKAAMMRPHVKVAMWNRYCKVTDDAAEGLGLERVEGSKLQIFRAKPKAATGADETAGAPATTDGHPQALVDALLGGSGADDDNGIIDKPLHDEAGTPAYYLLDLASTLIVDNLELQGHHKVLDMCAAPGGKSIAISQLLAPAVGDLTSNEPNKERCARLRRNLQEFLPINTITFNTTSRDGTLWHQPNSYDRVLLDAPCSGERHLVQQPPSVMATWAPAYTEGMAATQLTLLLRALETVKVGGRVVYSTCSISEAENDNVVRLALQKTRCGVKVRPTKLRIGEPTAMGWIVLPDTADGWGPMYCAAIEKTAEMRSQSDSDDSDYDDEEEEEESGEESD